MSEDSSLLHRLAGRATAAELAIAAIIKIMPDVRRDLMIQKLKEIEAETEANAEGEFSRGMAEALELMLK